jgi:hypothetical protein
MDRWGKREMEYKDDHSEQWVGENILYFLGVSAYQRL